MFMLKTNSENGHLLTKNSLISHLYIIFKLIAKVCQKVSIVEGQRFDMDNIGTVLKSTQMSWEFESDFQRKAFKQFVQFMQICCRAHTTMGMQTFPLPSAALALHLLPRHLEHSHFTDCSQELVTLWGKHKSGQ